MSVSSVFVLVKIVLGIGVLGGLITSSGLVLSLTPSGRRHLASFDAGIVLSAPKAVLLAAFSAVGTFALLFLYQTLSMFV